MRKMNPKTMCKYVVALLSVLTLTPCDAKAQKGVNRYAPWAAYQTPKSGLFWPQGQALPHFATPAATLDGLLIGDKNFPKTEKTLFGALQGLINRTKPRIILFEGGREGTYKWPNNLGLKVNEYTYDKRWEIVRKYKNEIDGVILYNMSLSPHYRNLASTIGGLKNALPVTQSEYDQLQNADINLPIIEDLTKLKYTHATQIYEYLYDNYWKDCTKRLFVSQNPNNGYIRDLGVAAGAAIVWLDPREWPQNTVLRKFLKDMTPGESILTGWWGEERSGIGLAAEYGLSMIPSDFYENTTVYAGMSHQINLPVVPKMPKLENKIYLSIYLSDGDNVQYCQHAMSELWDDKGRGSIPINWTISPGLADFGPGLLNYYYKTATPNDFFASGPSGLGYALIYDAHNYLYNATDGEKFAPYTKLTEQYLEKSGLRVITVWDEVNESQMETYTTNCRYLYGATQQDWERRDYKLQPVVKQEKLAFIPNLPCYASGVDVIYSFWKDQIADFDGSKPLFLSAQGESWKMGPDNIVALKEQLEKLSPGNIVICRGDHFFNLYNEANGLDFNLTLSGKMKITSSPTSTQVAYAADGTPSTDHKWISSGKGAQWIEFDFGDRFMINRYVVRHAGADGMDRSLNTKAFKIEVSSDGSKWATVDNQSNNKLNVTDVDIQPVAARYVRLSISNPGSDGIARIGDVEVFGKVMQ